ncbi:MAG: ribosome recycling factor [Clostridia bacterium]|nr:ribosome recycling factor [Clostridia bacterium]
MYDEIIEALKESLEKAINYYKSELSTIRAGRANPRILDKVMVNYYGNMTPLRQMANVSAPEARMLLISLWDTGALRDVIKALNDANLGLSPSDDGKIIRLVFPVLTEERRKDYVKSVKRMAEEAKITLRNERRDAIDMLKELKKDNILTEDTIKVAERDVQKEIDAYSAEVDELLKLKEKEILEI